ncbi:MAG: tRNA dihydrouridine(20/20a) synthase DusA [Acaryochloridaceae cyanobacterium RL_2_7]|nr:tRNA dihydrouridine(20/20a) synthase DusA [Acaryochloridaceae cyanobacterium RL_2_7]
MMDRTDRHYRYFMRQITQETWLYTEMVTSPAIKHGDRPHLLDYSPAEHPIALQVGGDDPEELALCARVAEDWGYDEINLNVGCPSSRVQSGNFGACLMAQPETVARCIESMRQATSIPVTVKHRIGIDDLDSYEDMARFVSVVSGAGCERFVVHARKAWLKGLSPKENRDVPPLRYEDVYRLKQDFPHLLIEINGGFLTHDQILPQLKQVDGVMIGRAAYDNPYLFAIADQQYYKTDHPIPSRHEVAKAMLPYIESWVSRGVKLNKITRHMLQLFTGQPGSRYWKRHLTELSCKPNAGPEVVAGALGNIPCS